MRRKILCLLTALLVMVSGCRGQLLLEDAGIILTGGLDIEGDRYRVYHATPVFAREAEKADDITTTTGYSQRETRNIINSKTTGQAVGGKLQTLLVGKQLIRRQNVFPLLDGLLRDPKNEINSRVVVVDGPVRDVMYADVEDKGRLGVVVREIIDSSYRNGTTVDTDLLQFHRQMSDPRITPFLAELSAKDDEIAVTGTALLDKDGKYILSLNREESSLLLLLQRHLRQPITLTFYPEGAKRDLENIVVNLEIRNASFDIQTDVRNNQFVFDIDVQLDVAMKERIRTLSYKGLEPDFERQLKRQCETLIHRLQRNELDPFGLGIYAKAYRYDTWKEVQTDWGKAFSKAKITVTPRIRLKQRGMTM
ncbi:Ger(x)C family spore germination protein [Desmospora profundinema]|uniref:Ger(X)C family germination protein n=1 Tax=Desmospora profundinema TaxID=1571184 RepID=A0ABU1IRC0_9BACL|nr:Ger(x)C family spore germination protein [Desmospora profundinema]MDR6227341.1 Ger(x)C family germination protein [Desmospora profundinema]